jgi:hypothetical protein
MHKGLHQGEIVVYVHCADFSVPLSTPLPLNHQQYQPRKKSIPARKICTILCFCRGFLYAKGGLSMITQDRDDAE